MRQSCARDEILLQHKSIRQSTTRMRRKRSCNSFAMKVGDVLPANREAATLLLTGHLWVRVYVPESWLGLIKLGEHVRVRVDSFPHTDFDGVVEQINRQAEFTPRNVQTVADRIKQVFG